MIMATGLKYVPGDLVVLGDREPKCTVTDDKARAIGVIVAVDVAAVGSHHAGPTAWVLPFELTRSDYYRPPESRSGSLVRYNFLLLDPA